MADEAPPGPWLYTGAIENHPDPIDRIAARRLETCRLRLDRMAAGWARRLFDAGASECG